MKNQPFNLSNLYFNTNHVSINYQLTGFTYNQIQYVEINRFIEYFNSDISVTSLRRLLKKVENKDCHQFFIRIENKLYLSRAILKLREENFSRIESLSGNWYSYLSAMDWDYFGHISFAAEYRCLTAREKMEKYFKKLTVKYSDLGFRLFYACEKNKENKGFHVHFILWASSTDKTAIKGFTENHFRGKSVNGTPAALTKIDNFTNNIGGEAYILKEIHLNPEGHDFHCKNAVLK